MQVFHKIVTVSGAAGDATVSGAPEDTEENIRWPMVWLRDKVHIFLPGEGDEDVEEVISRDGTPWPTIE